tara:strand:- start:1766 stop:2692 length:927 start_codon:yes stop_codon:yes gene_type:complete
MEIKPKQITWDQIPEGWMVQPKYDGECNKLIIKDGQANLQRFEGRSKTLFYPEIIEYANEMAKANLPDMVLVGEVCILLNELVASFPHIQLRMNTLSKAKQKLAMKDKLATFMAFDIEEYDGKNLDKLPYGERYSIMNSLFNNILNIAGTPTTKSSYNSIVTWKDGQPSARIMPVKNITSADHTWKEFVKEHEMEGIVVKNPDSPTEQVKLKNWDEDDFKIIDTELTDEGKSRGWFISKLKLEDTKGTHVDKGQQFDCKYINYPQTESAKELLIGKTAIIKYMKMKGRDGQYLAPRHPSLVEILEFKK